MLQAKPGDALVVKGWHGSGPHRTGLILEVSGKDGAAPYVVQWDDTRVIAVVHPVADAFVVHHAAPAEKEQS